MIAARTTEKKVSISRSRLRILQRHFEDDVSRIPTAVDYLFHQLEQIAQKNHLLCLVIALVRSRNKSSSSLSASPSIDWSLAFISRAVAASVPLRSCFTIASTVSAA